MVNQDNVIAMGKNIDYAQNLSLDTVTFIEDGYGSESTDHNVYKEVTQFYEKTDSNGNPVVGYGQAYGEDGKTEGSMGHYDANKLADGDGDGVTLDDQYDVDNCVRETGATVVLYTQSAGWVDAGSVEGTLAVGLDNLNAENKLTLTTQHIDANKSAVQTSKRSIQVS